MTRNVRCQILLLGYLLWSCADVKPNLPYAVFRYLTLTSTSPVAIPSVLFSVVLVRQSSTVNALYPQSQVQGSYS